MDHIHLGSGFLLLFTALLLGSASSPGLADGSDQLEEDNGDEDTFIASTLSAGDLLAEDTTNKESNTETIASTPTPIIRTTALYRLNTRNGAACILMKVDGVVLAKYKTKSGEIREIDRFIPDDATPGGDCSNEDTAIFSLQWRTFVLKFSFSKSSGGERWYTDKVELTYDTSDDIFENAYNPGRVKLSTPPDHSAMLFPTPVGNSYSCQDETSVELQNGGELSATVLLRDFKVQPFIFRNDEFGPVHECYPGGGRTYRDETAPIAVGSTLAVVVLLTVTGYGVYRYFKVKKVQYDTME